MKRNDYLQLRKEVNDLLIEKTKVIYPDDLEMQEIVENNLLKDFSKLPKHPETIRTLQGIKGFNVFLGTTEPYDNQQFVTNAIHDLSECIKNGLEPWFSPRLNRFVGYSIPF